MNMSFCKDSVATQPKDMQLHVKRYIPPMASNRPQNNWPGIIIPQQFGVDGRVNELHKKVQEEVWTSDSAWGFPLGSAEADRWIFF